MPVMILPLRFMVTAEEGCELSVAFNIKKRFIILNGLNNLVSLPSKCSAAKRFESVK
jgi:hypothetical protein